MKIKCIVIDDEPIALQKMQNYVEQTPYLELVAACDNPMDAIKVISENDIDAIFTDINMLGLNGLDFVSSLSECPLVVFITAYHEFAVESYKIGAVDYIVKPYGFKEFQRAADRVRTQYHLMFSSNTKSDNNSLFVRADYKWIHIKTENIRYIQGMSDYLRIHIMDASKPLITYATFAGIKKHLSSNFVQVHRSWIVNVEHIREINKNRIVMDEGTYIPVGNSFKEQLEDYLGNLFVGKFKK